MEIPEESWPRLNPAEMFCPQNVAAVSFEAA